MMDAVEYIKALRRLCKTQKICNGCPLRSNGACIAGLCDDGLCDGAEKAAQIVEQWSKNHPIKTRQSEFLKMFPDADLTRLLPCVIEKDKRVMRCAKYSCLSNPNYCGMCRDDYWTEEVDE